VALPFPGGIKPLEETVVLGEDGPKIVQLEIEGVITEASRQPRFPLEARESLIARLKEALDRAEKDDDVAALLLRIQSPGGTVSASETLYHEILEWKEETGRPVVAHLEGLATSGAYYVAMAADEVISHPTTVTGSIGVLFAGLNFSGLMEKLGVSNQNLTGGEYKDAGSPFRPMRSEERAQLQSVIDDFHARFREVVDGGSSAPRGRSRSASSTGSATSRTPSRLRRNAPKSRSPVWSPTTVRVSTETTSTAFPRARPCPWSTWISSQEYSSRSRLASTSSGPGCWEVARLLPRAGPEGPACACPALDGAVAAGPLDCPAWCLFL
jgi:signal peptide peptidase SppA